MLTNFETQDGSVWSYFGFLTGISARINTDLNLKTIFGRFLPAYGSHLDLEPKLKIEAKCTNIEKITLFHGFQDKMQFETVFGTAREGFWEV